MKERVVVAMSGGVDSSVAAAILKEKGYDVVGITMCFNLPDAHTRKPRCCGLQGIEDARRVAHKLKIRHYVLNMQGLLEKYVIRDFCREYLLGRTPNPCVRCNQFIKFEALLKKAFSLNAKYLATGHYARIVKNKGRYQLKKARDLRKDQSYFLYRLGNKQLESIIFPLGNLLKTEVRKLAKRYDLAIADKLESQEICFLPDMNYRNFLKARFSKGIKPGLVVDKQGNTLGRHKGIAFYTIGQRQGLGIARGYPVYITEINPINNRITIGNKEDACARSFLVGDLHFVRGLLKKKIAAVVRIRYNHREAPADLVPFGSQIKVYFHKPQFAIAPGQSAVFYDRDNLLGGGIIEKVLD